MRHHSVIITHTHTHIILHTHTHIILHTHTSYYTHAHTHTHASTHTKTHTPRASKTHIHTSYYTHKQKSHHRVTELQMELFQQIGEQHLTGKFSKPKMSRMLMERKLLSPWIRLLRRRRIQSKSRE